MEDLPILVSSAKRPTKLAKRAAKAACKKEFRKLERISRRKKLAECVSIIEQEVQQEIPATVECHDRSEDNQFESDNKRVSSSYKAQLETKLHESYISDHAVKICIDLSFVDLSSFIDVSHTVDEKWFTVEKEINSITKQLALSYSALRKHISQVNDATPICLQITSLPTITAESVSTTLNDRYAREMHESLTKQGFQNWKMGREHSAPWELYPKDKVVILSPDAETVLHDLDTEKVYVICGIVDRTVKKGWSLTRAKDLGLSCCRLPIQEVMAQRRTHILNIDHVLHAICAFSQCGDWATALEAAMPQRKKGGPTS